MTFRLKEFWNRVRAMSRRDLLDEDLNAELDAHLDLAIQDNLHKGMSPEEARRQALIRFGGMSQARELHREARGLPWFDVLCYDLRYTLRTLRKERSFTVIAVLILAIGIGANIAVFSVVNAILLRPLPFRQPHQLVWFAGNQGKGGLSEQTYTVDAFEQFRSHNQSFQDVTSYQTFYNSIRYKLIGDGNPKPVVGIQVAENFFSLLGVQPSLGRVFTHEECQKGGPPAVLLTHSFWKTQFGGDPSVVGKAININGEPLTVVGIIPATFDFGSVFSPGMKVDFFVPAVMDFWRTWGNTLAIVGRLQPGVTIAQAQVETNILFPQLYAANGWWSDYKSVLSGLGDHVSGKLRRSLIVLWCAVGLILLIACVNLSSLVLARMTARSKDFAMRSALGATRSRIVRQLLTESMALSLIGTTLGIGFAYVAVYYLAHQTSISLPLLSEMKVDAAALVWSAGVSLAVGLLLGLVCTVHVSSQKIQPALKVSGQGMTSSRKHEQLRAALVVSEVALACILLVGAGLLLRSFVRLLDVDLGFQPDNLAALKIEVDDTAEGDQRATMLQRVLQQVKALPGIESAAITDMLPLDRNRSWALLAKGRLAAKDENISAFVYVVSPGYFETMGMRLRAGRDFTWADTAKTQLAIIINEAAVRREWPGQNPLGRFAKGIGRGESQVIGVVSGVRESSLEDDSSPAVYVSAAQAEPEGAELVIRTRLPINVIGPSVMRTIRTINPGQPATDFRTIQQIVEHSVSPRRFVTFLVSLFAGLGLLLASLGIYGVISYSVARQKREIGIRMALGATRSRVQYGVISRTFRLAISGVLLGTLASYAVAHSISALLYGTDPSDPPTFAGVLFLLLGVALAAGYIPAYRASLIDPVVAIRNE